MNARRATLTLGAAAGGLLTTAFLQTAVASADGATNAFADLFGGLGTGAITDPFGGYYGGLGGDGFGAPVTAATAFGLVDPSQESVLTVSGLPPLDQQVEGYQTFGYVAPGSPADAASIGTVHTDVSTLTTPIGFTNTEYLVTGSSPDLAAKAEPSIVTDAATRLPELPTDGTTYDIARFDGFENIYSSVAPEAATRPVQDAADSTSGFGGLFSDLMGGGSAPTAGGDLVSDTFVTPFGSFDLTPSHRRLQCVRWPRPRFVRDPPRPE